jgi:dTDP-4-amino-4,6-dideoxygalactose transaminase
MLRPQLAELPRRVARWNTIHERIAAGLARSQHVKVPTRDGGQVFSATSVQFSAVGLDAAEIPAFLAAAKDRGLPIKWFGAEEQTGFTSAPRHWRYAGPQGPLAATHAVLATLCDIRTPVTLTDEECDLIAEIARDAIETVVSARPAARLKTAS